MIEEMKREQLNMADIKQSELLSRHCQYKADREHRTKSFLQHVDAKREQFLHSLGPVSSS